MRNILFRGFQVLVASRRFAIVFASLLFLGTIVLGEMLVKVNSRATEVRQRHDTFSQAVVIRSRIERELNSMLYLSSGLGSYLVVRRNSIHAEEVNDILAVLHRTSRHVRNFGVAIGYRLAFVHPIAGNEKAIGLNYRDQPQQWPVIERVIASGKPSLAGPIDLVQGGSGLVYRVPLSIEGQYWGLLSTVIDAESFFQALFESDDRQHFSYALRSRGVMGVEEKSVYGEQAIFGSDRAVMQEIEIPGGQWQLAVQPQPKEAHFPVPAAIRLVCLLLGGGIAWLIYLLMRHRSELTRLVMFDPLTGLATRRLLEDRHQMAVARLQRNSGHVCVMLFIDLDGFKKINDLHGHKAGDALLMEVARRLLVMLRSTDTVARWGGDEFVILLEATEPAEIDLMVSRIRTSIESPVYFDGHELRVGASVGIAIYPSQGAELQDILKAADQKMYADKVQRHAG